MRERERLSHPFTLSTCTILPFQPVILSPFSPFCPCGPHFFALHPLTLSLSYPFPFNPFYSLSLFRSISLLVSSIFFFTFSPYHPFLLSPFHFLTLSPLTLSSFHSFTQCTFHFSPFHFALSLHLLIFSQFYSLTFHSPILFIFLSLHPLTFHSLVIVSINALV